MADLETSQARIDTALRTLEDKIQALAKNDDQSGQVNRVTELESEVTQLRDAGKDALQELDEALEHLNAIGEETHG